MGQLAYLAIVNAMLATLLGLLVWAVSRWIRRPAFVHLLWILVLARFIAPPLLVVQVSGLRGWFSDTAPVRAAEVVQTVVRDVTAEHTRMLAMVRSVLEQDDLLPRKQLEFVDSGEPHVRRVGYVQVTGAVEASVAALQWLQSCLANGFRQAGNLRETLITIWLAGSVSFCLVQLYFGLRFRVRLRKEGYSSRIWQGRAERIARRMGMRSCPRVLLVRSPSSPMLWGFGRGVRLLFPERLLETLNTSAQDTLLAHELAHYRRGDQWVRLVELVVTALFWWHPVVWWAKHHLEAAEEECCDAWAVTQANGCPRIYAEALLAAVDFVSLGRPLLVPATSGVGSRLLRSRLTAIMRNASCRPPSLPHEAYALIWTLAFLVLLPCPALWQAIGSTGPTLPDSVVALVLPGPENFIEPRTQNWGISARATRSSPWDSPAGTLVAESADGRFRLTVDSNQRASLEEPASARNKMPGGTAASRRDLGVGRVATADFSPTGELLAIGGLDGTLELIECSSGKTRQRWYATNAAVLSVAFSPDGQRVAVGSRAGECKVFRISPVSVEHIQTARGHTVRCVRYSRDGSTLAVVVRSLSGDTRINLWDLASGRSRASLRPENAVAAVLATNTANEWLLVGEDGGTMLWSTDGAILSGKTDVPEGLVGQVRFTPLMVETIERWLDQDSVASDSVAQP